MSAILKLAFETTDNRLRAPELAARHCPREGRHLDCRTEKSLSLKQVQALVNAPDSCDDAFPCSATVNGFATVLARIQETPGQRSARRINEMRFEGTPRNRVKYLEVLAGAISWGFKSPSPHHKMSFGFISLRPPFFRVTFL